MPHENGTLARGSATWGKRQVRTVKTACRRWPPAALWMAVLTFCLAGPPVCFTANTPACRLSLGLYQSWWKLERAMQGARNQTAWDRLVPQQLEIDQQYVQFFDALAEASLRGDEDSFEECMSLAKMDPFAAEVAALVAYLHGGRKDPRGLLASLPENNQQLAVFWNLDSVAISSRREGISNLPGIPLPDGLAEKITDELLALTLKGNAAAAREYFYMYQNSDGGFAEFLADRSIKLVRYHPDVVLRLWQAVRIYMPRLAADETADEDDTRMAGRSLRAACREHRYPSCPEALRIFHRAADGTAIGAPNGRPLEGCPAPAAISSALAILHPANWHNITLAHLRSIWPTEIAGIDCKPQGCTAAWSKDRIIRGRCECCANFLFKIEMSRGKPRTESLENVVINYTTRERDDIVTVATEFAKALGVKEPELKNIAKGPYHHFGWVTTTSRGREVTSVSLRITREGHLWHLNLNSSQNIPE